MNLLSFPDEPRAGAAGGSREELQVERVILRVQANQEPPHGATADFDLVRMVNAAEAARQACLCSSNDPKPE